MKVHAIIPARLGSTRLPRKVLADIHGKPLIWHVWNRVKQAKAFSDIYVATDADEVREVMENFGAKVLMTPTEARSGTERLVYCLDHIDANLVVNVQGDEPLIDPAMLNSLVQKWVENPSDLITPVFPITSIDDVLNPNIVKVIRTASGEIAYFSRSPIPYVRDLPHDQWLNKASYWGHIGVYGYKPPVLKAYLDLPVSMIEQAEQLEQLRFLNAGYTFQSVETNYRLIAVDVQSDLDHVRSLIERQA